MNKHTVGPWAFCNDTLCQATGKYLHLGKWVESPGLGKAAEANKALIAAAPDLLAALESILVYAENEAMSLDSLKDSEFSAYEAFAALEAVDSARAAIAKAKGE